MNAYYPMNIEEINRRHFFSSDQVYRIHYGLHSKLIGFENGIFSIEVIFNKKWREDYNTTAHELAHFWKENTEELEKSIGCKVYIIDARLNPFKQEIYYKNITPSYDARKGLLFEDNLLN